MTSFPVNTNTGKGISTAHEKITSTAVGGQPNPKINNNNNNNGTTSNGNNNNNNNNNNGNSIHRTVTATTGGGGVVSSDGIDTFQIQLDLDPNSRPNTALDAHGHSQPENMDISLQGGEKSQQKK